MVGDANVIQDYSADVFRQLILEFFPFYYLGLTIVNPVTKLKSRVA